jgi:hypothetical protein
MLISPSMIIFGKIVRTLFSFSETVLFVSRKRIGSIIMHKKSIIKTYFTIFIDAPLETKINEWVI